MKKNKIMKNYAVQVIMLICEKSQIIFETFLLSFMLKFDISDKQLRGTYEDLVKKKKF